MQLAWSTLVRLCNDSLSTVQKGGSYTWQALHFPNEFHIRCALPLQLFAITNRSGKKFQSDLRSNNVCNQSTFVNFRLFLKHLPVWFVPSRPFGVHDGQLQLSSDIFILMMITVFWNIAPCRLVNCYRLFGGFCCFHFRRVQEWLWTWRQKASSKLRYQITNQHNVISHKSVLFDIKSFFAIFCPLFISCVVESIQSIT